MGAAYKHHLGPIKTQIGNMYFNLNVGVEFYCVSPCEMNLGEGDWTEIDLW